MAKLRVTDAARLLGLHPMTVRKWAKEGKLEYTWSVAGQRLFDSDYLEQLVRDRNPESDTVTVFYVRSSGASDVLQETQKEKLTTAYGEPARIFTDAASGLNENRRGLRQLLDFVKESTSPVAVFVTNKDRLTRFGFAHMVELIEAYGGTVTVLDSDDTKEPMDVLLQDFMSLLASFSGKFYRIRGWAQQRQLLEKASAELNTREQL